MSTLECKGITWVGNLYQKFEAICLEVEDIVCEETTKIVENQVQSVGVSVKKFYAELVQDLLPPSTKDHEKLKEGIDENPIEELPPTEELEVVAPDGKDLSRGSSFKVLPNISHLLPPSSEDHVKGTGADFSIKQTENSSVIHEKLKFGVVEFTEDDELSSPKVLEVITPPGNDLSGALLFTGLHNENDGKIRNTIATVPSHLPPPSYEDPVKGRGADLSVEQTENSSVTHGKLKFGVGEFIEDDELSSPKVSEVIAPPGNDLSGASLSTGLHYENKICNTTATLPTLTSVDVAQCNSIGGAGKSCCELLDAMGCISDVSSASSTSWVLQTSYFEYKAGAGLTTSRGIPAIDLKGNSKTYKIISPMHGRSDGYNAEEMAEGNYAAKSDEEIINTCHSVKLEESCILVDSDELHLVSQRTGKQRSYKKKLRDAFASRMRSRKKQEYEQLALLCGDVDTGTYNQRAGGSQISNVTSDLDSKKSPIADSFDSEWELL
ncbi:hypothetical protein NE237_000733 [Protea cynaroides]|uniref:Uncharacterized protein n=1 Tax=Protea cynaroides TaxID=273540 RepID=A0A9Q0QXR3_9MAGN|nr:hypothetical protein NE237_000733 [Protea cynaroides]